MTKNYWVSVFAWAFIIGCCCFIGASFGVKENRRIKAEAAANVSALHFTNSMYITDLRIETNPDSDVKPFHAPPNARKQFNDIAEISFRSGAIAMANAIRENPSVSKKSGGEQIEAAEAWWRKNSTGLVPFPLKEKP